MTPNGWAKHFIVIGTITVWFSLVIVGCENSYQDRSNGAIYVNNITECSTLDQYFVSDTLAAQLNKLGRAEVLTEDYINLYHKIDSAKGLKRLSLNYVLDTGLSRVQLQQLLVCCYTVKGKALIISDTNSTGYIDLSLANDLNLKLDSLMNEGLFGAHEEVALDNNFDVLMITRPTSVTFVNFGTEEAYVDTHYDIACSNLYEDGNLYGGGYIILKKDRFKK